MFGRGTKYEPLPSRNTFFFKTCFTQRLSSEETRSLWVKERDIACKDLTSGGVKPSKKFSVRVQSYGNESHYLYENPFQEHAIYINTIVA